MSMSLINIIMLPFLLKHLESCKTNNLNQFLISDTLFGVQQDSLVNIRTYSLELMEPNSKFNNFLTLSSLNSKGNKLPMKSFPKLNQFCRYHIFSSNFFPLFIAYAYNIFKLIRNKHNL